MSNNPILTVNVNAPAVGSVKFHTDSRVLIALENLWLTNSEFSIECPYPNSIKGILTYLLSGLKRFKFVPFANAGEYQEIVDAYSEKLTLWLSDLDNNIDELLTHDSVDGYMVDIGKATGLDYSFVVSIGITFQAVDIMTTLMTVLEHAAGAPQSNATDDLIEAVTGEPLLPLDFVTRQSPGFPPQLKAAVVTNSFQRIIMDCVGQITASERSSFVKDTKRILRGLLRDLNSALAEKDELVHGLLKGYTIDHSQRHVVNFPSEGQTAMLGMVIPHPLYADKYGFVSKVTDEDMYVCVAEQIEFPYPGAPVVDVDYGPEAKPESLIYPINARVSVIGILYPIPIGMVLSNMVIVSEVEGVVTPYGVIDVVADTEDGLYVYKAKAVRLTTKEAKEIQAMVYPGNSVTFDDSLKYGELLNELESIAVKLESGHKN